MELQLHDFVILPLLPAWANSSQLPCTPGIPAAGPHCDSCGGAIEPFPNAFPLGLPALHGELALWLVCCPQQRALQAPEAQEHRRPVLWEECGVDVFLVWVLWIARATIHTHLSLLGLHGCWYDDDSSSLQALYLHHWEALPGEWLGYRWCKLHPQWVLSEPGLWVFFGHRMDLHPRVCAQGLQCDLWLREGWDVLRAVWSLQAFALGKRPSSGEVPVLWCDRRPWKCTDLWWDALCTTGGLPACWCAGQGPQGGQIYSRHLSWHILLSSANLAFLARWRAISLVQTEEKCRLLLEAFP